MIRHPGRHEATHAVPQLLPTPCSGGSRRPSPPSLTSNLAPSPGGRGGVRAPPPAKQAAFFQQQAGAEFGIWRCAPAAPPRPLQPRGPQSRHLRQRSPQPTERLGPTPSRSGLQPPPRLPGRPPGILQNPGCELAAKKSCTRARHPGAGEKRTPERRAQHRAVSSAARHAPPKTSHCLARAVRGAGPTSEATHPRRGDCSSRQRAEGRRPARTAPCFPARGRAPTERAAGGQGLTSGGRGRGARPAPPRAAPRPRRRTVGAGPELRPAARPLLGRADCPAPAPPPPTHPRLGSAEGAVTGVSRPGRLAEAAVRRGWLRCPESRRVRTSGAHPRTVPGSLCGPSRGLLFPPPPRRTLPQRNWPASVASQNDCTTAAATGLALSPSLAHPQPRSAGSFEGRTPGPGATDPEVLVVGSAGGALRAAPANPSSKSRVAGEQRG